MKMLDEVIKAFECCDHGEPDSNCKECSYDFLGACCRVREEDALTYLRGYREVLPEYAQMKADAALNTPLTWDELKTMEGKPVWVAVDGKERWRIIREVSSEHLILESGLPLHRCWMNHPDGWQAYRKERG